MSASNDSQIVLATGYTRIVYGDHGPYFEFDEKHIGFSEFPNIKIKSQSAYYDERFTEDKLIMLYVQKRSVKGVPNPPRKGKLSVFNNRSEGYADYKPGMYYVSAFELRAKRDDAEANF